MFRFPLLGALVPAVYASVCVPGAFAANRVIGVPAARAVLPVCAGTFQRVAPGGGRLGGPACAGVLGLFDYGPTGAAQTTFVRVTSSAAVPPSAMRLGGLPRPPLGTWPQAYFEVVGLSSAPAVSFGAPVVDHSLVASPLIVRGARYELIGYAPTASGPNAGLSLVYRSGIYTASASGVLPLDSPLAGLTVAQPAQLYFELLRTQAAGPVAGEPLAAPGAAWSTTTLHHFTGKTDGQLEWGGLLLGSGGVLYGTATAGGSYGFIHTKTEVVNGYGTIFEVIPPAKGQTAYTTRVIHSFTGGSDGKFPYGSLIADKNGQLYGITTGSFAYAGSVFRLSPPAKGQTQWVLTPLHIFTGKSDGNSPQGDLIVDPAGNLYGTTYLGGFGCNTVGCGVVFELSPPAKGQTKWTEKVLYAFSQGADGGNPEGGLARSPTTGALYGMTSLGGNPNAFAGTVFGLSPPAAGKSTWGFHLLHTFSGLTDGGNPNAAPILDARGALYGTTVLGGSFFEGTAFKLEPPSGNQHAWAETVLHNFGEGKDGVVPHGTLIFDKAGALYGTALAGGTTGLGMAFKLSPPTAAQHSWLESELAGFAGGFGGDGPNAGLIFDSSGFIYGTTSGSRLEDYGTVFKLMP